MSTESKARELLKLLESYGKCKICGEGFWFGQAMRSRGDGHVHVACVDREEGAE